MGSSGTHDNSVVATASARIAFLLPSDVILITESVTVTIIYKQFDFLLSTLPPQTHMIYERMYQLLINHHKPQNTCPWSPPILNTAAYTTALHSLRDRRWTRFIFTVFFVIVRA